MTQDVDIRPLEGIAPTRCTNLRRNLGWYQLYANLCAGGARVFTPPHGTIHPISGQAIATYLEQCEAEPTEEFLERLRNSFFLPYPAEIITTYTSTLFRQEVYRDPVASIFGEGLLADLDLRGHSVREFLRRAFNLAQIEGWVGVLTDAPRVEGSFPSAYHEAAAGLRPYSTIVLPTRLWDWSRDAVTGEFLYAEIWNGCEGKDGAWRRWSPTEWMDVDQSGQRTDGGAHTLGRIPLDLLVCQAAEQDSCDDPFGQSALSGVANVALHCYQMCSLLEAHERRALFAFLHIKEDPAQYKETKPSAGDLTLGSSHWLWSPGDVNWIEPPRSVPEEARAQILWAVQEMRRATGVATRSEESVEAHSGVALSWEYSGRHNAVYERAQNLEDFEARLWRTYGAIMGLDVPFDAIRYPREYAVQPVEQELAELKSLGEIAAQWPGATEALLPLVRTKLRRVAIRDIGHLPEIDDVLAAVDDLAFVAPVEPVAIVEQPAAEDVSDQAADVGESIEEVSTADLDVVKAESMDMMTQLKLIEQLVKSKAPDEMVRVLLKRIASQLDIAEPEVISAISTATFRWYTEVQAEIAATGEPVE